MAERHEHAPARGRFDTTLLQMDNIDTALGVEVIAACRGIRTLGVHTYEGQDGGYVWCSSSSASDIQTLSIGVPRAFPRDVAPLNLHLRHLVLSVSDELEEHHLHTIAKTSSESLTSLWLHGLLSEQCASGLLAFLADTNLPKLKTLAFEGSDNGGLDMWSDIIDSIPSLTALEIHPYDKNLKTAIMALGESATPNIELIRIIGSWWLPEVWIDAFMYIIKQPNLAGLRRLEFDNVVRWEFVATAGLKLLKECEKRSIVVVTKGEHL
ncbi:hypothetical protein RQP46_003947 [Phenoliferia psychrophenolica]